MDVMAMVEEDAQASTAAAFTTLAVDYLAATRDRSGQASTKRSPADLAAQFAEPLPTEGRPIADVLARLRDEILPDCNHLYHPRYMGHQVSAPLPAAIWTEPLISALNQSLAVWEMSPVATVLEHQVIGWLTTLVGWGRTAGGTLTTGGTEATATGLLAARSALLPDVWTAGIGRGAELPVLICGEHAHYAIRRAAGTLGLGTDQVRAVRSRDHRMDVAALAEALETTRRQGRAVLAVVATAGSTPTGSFDDLEAIGSLCDTHDVWLHVDAAHGGSALLSPRSRQLLRGIERARSVALDPHKMMLLPLQAGTLLVRDVRQLDAAFVQRAPYLFHDGADERTWDLGGRSFLCSRRADVLKLWVALQRYGADGIGALYDRLCQTARALFDAVARHPAFAAAHEPACNILCFRYVGRRGEFPLDGSCGPQASAAGDALNQAIRTRYNRSGEGWITSTVLDGRRVLRVTVMNPRTTHADVRAVVTELARIGDALAGPGDDPRSQPA